MKYAWSPEVRGEHVGWTLEPWRRRGLVTYDKLSQIPSDTILVVPHFAPWWEPLQSWIREGRPWIEIEYGYWGPDTPRRTTRRVTYRGHHNLVMRTPPHSRQEIFKEPHHLPWRSDSGDYVLAIEPVEEILTGRTGESMYEFHERLEQEIRQYWSGEIRWRRKVGAKANGGRWFTFVEQLKHAHAVVGERTMAATEACLLGVPGYTVDRSMSTLLMGGLENLATQNRPDRQAWWEHICWSQFAPEEFQTTVPADLVEAYQIAPV